MAVECDLGRLGNPTGGAAHAARGGSRVSPPGRTGPHTQAPGGSQHDGFTRGVHVLFAQESRAQVRGRNGLEDDGACLLRKGARGLLNNLGARKAKMGRFGSELVDPRTGSPE